MNKLNQRGFTLIELVLVITVLGILAVAAIPQFINVTQDAAMSARDGVVGAVRSAIALDKAEDLVGGGNGAAPAALDNSAANIAAGTNEIFFENILQEGVTDGIRWSKGATVHTYVFTAPDNTTYQYVYDPGTGAFAGP
jgi:prepilin-type N-terminal cleavage/methylation domain-containing protein